MICILDRLCGILEDNVSYLMLIIAINPLRNLCILFSGYPVGLSHRLIIGGDIVKEESWLPFHRALCHDHNWILNNR